MNAREVETRESLREGKAGDPWWLIHSRPRCEKQMARWLEREGYRADLPLRRRVREYPGKRVTFLHPIFPGYVFGAFPMRARSVVYGSGYAAAVIRVDDQERLERELASLHRALEAGVPLRECPYLSVGQRVRIATGRLRGVEGLVVRRAGRARLILSVDLLQRSVAMEVDPEWVVPCT